MRLGNIKFSLSYIKFGAEQDALGPKSPRPSVKEILLRLQAPN